MTRNIEETRPLTRPAIVPSGGGLVLISEDGQRIRISAEEAPDFLLECSTILGDQARIQCLAIAEGLRDGG